MKSSKRRAFDCRNLNYMLTKAGIMLLATLNSEQDRLELWAR
jgi:hypothetical protein